MLNLLRKKKIMKRILWGMAIVIIPAFILWGAGSLVRRRRPFKYVGVIGGKNVSVDDFIKSVKEVRVGLFLNYFNQPEALDKIQKDRSLLNRLAWQNLLIKKAAEKDKISVTDKEVVAFITGHPLFSRGGVFDDKLYNYILRNNIGMAPRVFEESVRSFLVNLKYRHNAIRNVTVSEAELRQAYKNEFEKAKVQYVAIDKDIFKKDIKIAEGEIASFYEKNKERFRDKEKVILRYIAFPHKNEGERKKALADLKRAYGILRSKPRDMEKLAAKLSLAVKETPPFSRDEIVPGIGVAEDISAVSFGMRPGIDIFPVINREERGTSYIIQVKEKIPPALKPKDKVSAYIADLLRDEKAAELAGNKAGKIHKDATDNGLTLAQVARKYGLKLRKSDFVTRFDYIEGVGEAHKIVEAASRLKTGELSRPIKTRKGFLIMEVLDFQGIDEKKFEKEKDSYRNKVLAAKKMKALEKKIAELEANSALSVDLRMI